MPHALVSNLVHCVFSTKGRVSSISDPNHLCRYLGGLAKEKKLSLIVAGGTANHIHLLIALPAAVSLAKAVQDLKGNSSRWMKSMVRVSPGKRGMGHSALVPQIDGQ
jgi:putative transposase